MERRVDVEMGRGFGEVEEAEKEKWVVRALRWSERWVALWEVRWDMCVLIWMEEDGAP